METTKRSKMKTETRVATDKEAFTTHLDFGNGQTTEFTLNKDQFLQFAIFGLQKKLSLVFSANGLEGVNKFMRDETIEDWALPTVNTKVDLLTLAMMEAFNLTQEKVEGFLENKSTEEKRALRNADEVAPIYARLKVSQSVGKKKDESANLIASLKGLQEL